MEIISTNRPLTVFLANGDNLSLGIPTSLNRRLWGSHVKVKPDECPLTTSDTPAFPIHEHSGYCTNILNIYKTTSLPQLRGRLVIEAERV
jgi:hypothetical protein